MSVSKFVGCMLGCAVGDALGLSMWKGFFDGRWSDDTHMMIGVAESLVANKGFNGSHMAQTFVRNYEQEPWRGYANGPLKVFRLIKSGVSWSEAAESLFGGEGSYGNGAAMRVAPVGLLYFDDVESLRIFAYEQSRITHTNKLGMEGAALQAYAVALAVKADPRNKISPKVFLEELINFADCDVYKFKLKKVGDLLKEANRHKVVRELGNGVEAHNSVPTAIYSFLRNIHSFEDAVTYAVSLGGDADTIGAMTGAISGAYHGSEMIPQRWRGKVERRKYIEDLAKKLWEVRAEHCKSADSLL